MNKEELKGKFEQLFTLVLKQYTQILSHEQDPYMQVLIRNFAPTVNDDLQELKSSGIHKNNLGHLIKCAQTFQAHTEIFEARHPNLVDDHIKNAILEISKEILDSKFNTSGNECTRFKNAWNKINKICNEYNIYKDSIIKIEMAFNKELNLKSLNAKEFWEVFPAYKSKFEDCFNEIKNNIPEALSPQLKKELLENIEIFKNFNRAAIKGYSEPEEVNNIDIAQATTSGMNDLTLQDEQVALSGASKADEDTSDL